MSTVLLYLILLKAVATSFSGLASLPVLRADLVEHYRVLTDAELSTAVAIGRAGPGPIGLYVVSVGYFAGGVPGACAGLLALVTPAFLIIPAISFLRGAAGRRELRGAVHGVMFAAAGLLACASLPLARSAITGPLSSSLAAASFLALALTRADTVWVVVGGAAVGLLAAWAG
ncbi:MAG: chromate transporter [Bryobacterales bacterium]|nr:chromate transporter [Bryobacteraceae bacterium]MDW8353698.1 chromate transporter [Bryobacterales bacterium]